MRKTAASEERRQWEEAMRRLDDVQCELAESLAAAQAGATDREEPKNDPG